MTDLDSSLPFPRLEEALHRRSWLVLAVLLLFAAGVRGVLFSELIPTPIAKAHAFENSDMQFFDHWARSIVGGDLLSETVGHPVHDWHVDVARAHFAKNPGALPTGFDQLDEAGQKAAAKTLWDGWYGGVRFHQEPFYAYVLAGLYSVFGVGDAVPMFCLQGLLSLLTLALLFRLTRQLFGVGAAAVTLVVGSCWVPWIHYDLTLLRTSWIVFFGVLLAERAEALVRSSQSTTAEGAAPVAPLATRALLIFGVLVGLATSLRSTFLAYGAGLCCWALLRRGGLVGGVLRRSWIPLLGVAGVLLPVWIRNAAVGAPWFSMTSVGPVTLAGGNLPGVVVTGGWFIQPVSEEMAAVMGTGGGLVETASTIFGMYAGLVDWLSLLGEKFLFVWHWYETPNNTSVYFVRMHSASYALLLSLVQAVWILPAGLIGMLATVLAKRRGGVLWWHFVISLAPLIVFYVLSRFRLPMVVGMLPFLGFGAVQVVAWSAARQLERVVGCVLLGVVLGMAMSRPLLPKRPFLSAHPYVAAAKAYYQPQATAALEVEDYGRVIQVYSQMINTRPGWIDRIGPDRPLRDEVELGMVKYAFLPAYQACLVAAQQGRMIETMEVFRPHVARFTRALEVGIQPR